MATYFAQAAGAIQSIEWDTAPTGGGTDLVWANLDPADVLCANGKAITWAAASVPTLTCARLSTTGEGTGTAGGGFALSGSTAVAITADLTAGTTACLTSTHTGTGANGVTITGAVTGGSGSYAYGAVNQNPGTLTITGAVTGGSGAGAHGALNQSTGTLTITGAVTGGSVANAFGARNNGTGTLTINGTVAASSTARAFGVYNNSTGVITVIGSLVDTELCSAYAGAIFWQPASMAHYHQTPWNGSYNFRYTVPPMAQNVRDGVQRGYMLEVPDNGTLQIPAEADVKAGVGYGAGGTEFTGTLAAGGGGVPLIGPGGLVG